MSDDDFSSPLAKAFHQQLSKERAGTQSKMC